LVVGRIVGVSREKFQLYEMSLKRAKRYKTSKKKA